MNYTKQLSIMSEKSPSTTTPLVNHLNFDDMAKYGNDILIVTAAEIPDLELHTKIYLHQLSTIPRSLTDHYQSI